LGSFVALPAALQIGVRGPVPVAAGKFFAEVHGAIDFALREYQLPVTRFIQVVIHCFHIPILLFLVLRRSKFSSRIFIISITVCRL
jgi:hypothetical protein